MKLTKKGNGWKVMPRFRNLLDDFWGADRFFEGEWPLHRAHIPAVNIRENDDNFEIEVAAPGLTKDDFDIVIENGVLSISCEKSEEKEETQESFTRREFNYSSFERNFSLPDSVDVDEIDATYHDGVLRLRLSKRVSEEPPKKKIAIQ